MTHVDFDGDHSDTDPCACGSCEWHGEARYLDDIDDCSLTPGDASPAGRCPRCGSLAYLDRPKDRMKDKAEHMAGALRQVLALIDGRKTLPRPNDRLALDIRMALDYFDAKPASTCAHAESEDCMNCQQCGMCSESLDEQDDICDACREANGDLPDGWRLATSDEIAQGFSKYQHESGAQQADFPKAGDHE